MTHRCERVWQAETLVDQRLAPNDRASFERHLQACDDCTQEVHALRELSGVMANAARFERPELERRRARVRLLNEASQHVLTRRSPASRLALWTFAAALPALALCALLLRRPATAGFDVTDLNHAKWQAVQQGGTTRVVLSAGVAAFHVEHLAAGARFLVALPDGEIEVRGTRFVVEVDATHTRSVAVSEGTVALRLAGAEQLLHGGESWTAETPERSRAVSTEPAAAPSAAGALVDSRPAPALAVAPGVEPTSAAPAPRAALASAGPARDGARANPVAPVVSSQVLAGGAVPSVASAAVAPTPAVVNGSPGARFAAAIASFSAGDYGRADQLLAAFTRDFPNDARAEDAAFLRADARARRGDRAGAAAAARSICCATPKGCVSRKPNA